MLAIILRLRCMKETDRERTMKYPFIVSATVFSVFRFRWSNDNVIMCCFGCLYFTVFFWACFVNFVGIIHGLIIGKSWNVINSNTISRVDLGHTIMEYIHQNSKFMHINSHNRWAWNVKNKSHQCLKIKLLFCVSFACATLCTFLCCVQLNDSWMTLVPGIQFSQPAEGYT